MDATTTATYLSHRETRVIVWGVLLPLFMGSLDNTILASALPTIGGELGDVRGLPWLITIYLLAATAAMPLYGKIADIRGRRFALHIGIPAHGGFAHLRVRALDHRAHSWTCGAGPRRRRPFRRRRDRAGRRRRPQGARPLLRLFLDRLHHRRRVRPRARRLHRRPSALVRHLLAQHPARPPRACDHSDGPAATAAKRAQAPARRDRRAP